jgi:hypothetical protein
MMHTKFIVKLNRLGKSAAEYVLRTDHIPLRTTTNRKLALVMGKFTAEDVAKSVETARCKAELVSVEVTA